MRILLWVLPICVAVSACNMAVSKYRMLNAEPKATMKFKDGLWALEDPQCKYDPALPTNRWPQCVDWLIFANGSVVDSRDAQAGDAPQQIVPVAGSPLIVEFPFEQEGQKRTIGYAYVALEPMNFDGAGSTIELQIWPVACGTEPDKRRGSGTDSNFSRFAGMDVDCQPASVQTLRVAASAGPQGEYSAKVRLRWVRAVTSDQPTISSGLKK